jgi:hypothetical protein
VTYKHHHTPPQVRLRLAPDTDVEIGGVRISGIPVDTVPAFLAEVVKQISNIASAAIKQMKDMDGSVTVPNV